jgi:hypothetical protein
MQNNKILGKTFFDWTIIGGSTIIPRSLKTAWNKKKISRKAKFLKKIIYDPLIFANNRFSKI